MSDRDRSFAYVAVDTAGRRERGRASAPSAEGVLRALHDRGLVAIDVRDAPADAGRAPRFGGRQARLELTRTLAAMLASGTPVARALATAASIVPAGAAKVAESVRTAILRGDSLAAALEREQGYFPPVYVGIVRAGERAGDLAGAFDLLVAQLEKEDRLRARLLSAALYPIVLAVAGTIAMLVLLLFVLPRFIDLLQGAQVALPPATAALIALSRFVAQRWPLLLGGALAVATALALHARTTTGKRHGAQLLVRLPVIGPLRREVLAARFARLTGVMLASGAPLLAAIDEAGLSLPDPLARDAVQRVRTAVREGTAFSQALADGTLFPGWFARLIAVGERSGRLAEYLESAATLAEERTERTLQRLVVLAEPAMILAFGGVVGFVALALLQAIYGVSAGSFR